MTIQQILNQLDGGITTANADRVRAMRPIRRMVGHLIADRAFPANPEGEAMIDAALLDAARSTIRGGRGMNLEALSFALEGVAHADGRLGILKEVRGRLLKVEEEMV